MRLFLASPLCSACQVGLSLPVSTAVLACYDFVMGSMQYCGWKTTLHHRHALSTRTPCSTSSKCRIVEQDQEVDAPDILVFGWRPPHMNVSHINSRIALGRPTVPGLTALIRHLIKLSRAVPQRLEAGEVSRPPERDLPPPRR